MCQYTHTTLQKLHIAKTRIFLISNRYVLGPTTRLVHGPRQSQHLIGETSSTHHAMSDTCACSVWSRVERKLYGCYFRISTMKISCPNFAVEYATHGRLSLFAQDKIYTRCSFLFFSSKTDIKRHRQFQYKVDASHKILPLRSAGTYKLCKCRWRCTYPNIISEFAYFLLSPVAIRIWIISFVA